MSWTIGTATFTNGSAVVTKTGGVDWSNPLNGVREGRMIIDVNNVISEILRVDNANQLTLRSAYTGSTGSKSYRVPTSPDVSLDAMALDQAAFVAYFQGQIGGYQQLLTGTGNVTITAPDGTSVTVRSQAEWDRLLNTKVTGETQTSSTDATPNRVLKMAANGAGPFGLGSSATLLATTDVVVQLRSAASGYYRCAVNTIRAPSTAAWGFHVVRWDANTAMVIAISTVPAGGMQYIVIGSATDSGWRPLYDNNNLKFPLSLSNGGSNKNVGAFANGPNVQDSVPIATFLASADAYGNNSAGSVSINDDGGSWHTYINVKHRSGLADGVNYGFMLEDRNMTASDYGAISIRKRVPAGWLAPVTVWHSNNLEKQTSTMDTAPNRVAITNAYGMGLGGMLPTTLNYADISTSGVTRAFKSPSGGINWPTNDVAWVGQHWAYDNNAGASLAILAAQSAASVRAAVKVRRNASDFTWMNVLLSNQYTVDANGFYKTASPVINIYADGSFTTTDEAAGVNVERLSEGVYKITGCQGMHSDAAWNGIDGGVSNPKCRNGQELTWNNYEVAEDGSVTVYTFHRVHPEAMPFAQNRLTLDKEPFDDKKGHTLDMEWPDQTPIDVPRGMFIQVRVNMPERESETISDAE